MDQLIDKMNKGHFGNTYCDTAILNTNQLSKGDKW